MASQVVEQMSQLEQLCGRLYLSQVGVSADQALLRVVGCYEAVQTIHDVFAER